MSTFYNNIEEILKDKKKWKYYDSLNIEEKLESILEKPKEFITSYLKAGGKLPNELNDILNSLDKPCLQHIISIFFLGLILHSKILEIEKSINLFIKKKSEEVKTKKYSDINLTFCYNWFLICFFHDVGYSRMVKINGNSKIKIFGEIENDNIKNKVINILKDNPCNDSIPKEINKSWWHYLDFKESHINPDIQEDIDHGILAGAYFYFMLKNIYQKKIKQFDKKEEVVDDANLFWSKKMLERVHKPIAWIIVAHNIWFKNQNYENVDEYKKPGLINLIINKPIIKLDKYPLYFLLSLVDTIDPIKFVTKKKDKMIISDILKKINFHIDKDILNIEFENNLKSLSKSFFMSNKNINYWIDLKCEENGELISFILTNTF